MAALSGLSGRVIEGWALIQERAVGGRLLCQDRALAAPHVLQLLGREEASAGLVRVVSDVSGGIATSNVIPHWGNKATSPGPPTAPNTVTIIMIRHLLTSSYQNKQETFQ